MQVEDVSSRFWIVASVAGQAELLPEYHPLPDVTGLPILTQYLAEQFGVFLGLRRPLVKACRDPLGFHVPPMIGHSFGQGGVLLERPERYPHCGLYIFGVVCQQAFRRVFMADAALKLKHVSI